MEEFMVPRPMKRPDYVFYTAPTTDQLRRRAVQAMRDHLSIQWFTRKKLVHGKTGPVSGKRFIYDANVIFAGLPYTNGDKGLFQFLEYYDHETGALRFKGDGDAFNKAMGCTCAGGVMWGWSCVCHSLTGVFINFYMVPKWGVYPVGDIRFPFDIDSFLEYSTKRIIEENGLDCVLDAYGKCRPGDAVTSSPFDHTMMVIDYPHVEYGEDGKIDLNRSYLMIQDQRGGYEDGFYDRREEDDLVHYSGRIEYRYTYAMLLEESYIPVSPGELLGTVPYERAKVEYHGEADSLVALQEGTVTCNYPMAVLKLMLTKENGSEVMVARHLFTKWENHKGLTRSFPLKNLAEYHISFLKGKRLRVEVTATNGEVFTPVTIEL